MAELALGVFGIVVPALQGVRRLLEDIDNIVKAPKDVASLKDDLLSVEMALEGLNAVKPSEREVLGGAATKPFEFAISTCKTACGPPALDETFRGQKAVMARAGEFGILPGAQDKVTVRAASFAG